MYVYVLYYYLGVSICFDRRVRERERARAEVHFPTFFRFFFVLFFWNMTPNTILTLTGCICVLTSNVSSCLVWVIRSERCRRLSMIRFLITPAQVTTLPFALSHEVFFLSLLDFLVHLSNRSIQSRTATNRHLDTNGERVTGS